MAYGDGVMYMDRAVADVLRAVQRAQSRHGLTDKAVRVVLSRIRFAETPHSEKPFAHDVNRLGVLPTDEAVG